MKDRTCPGCAVALPVDAHGRRRFCSDACRTWVRKGHTELRVVPVACIRCGASMAGKMVTALYCTRKCKAAASESRRPERNDAARYLREREYRIAAASEYARRNPHVGQAAKRRRKALAANTGTFRITGKDWLRLCRQFDHRCAYCDRKRPLTMDHVVPLTRGGRHSIGNLLPVCASCNASKSNRFLVEWRYGRKAVRTQKGGESPSPGSQPSRVRSRPWVTSPSTGSLSI